MLRITATCALIALTLTAITPALAAEKTVAEQAAKRKPGQKIKVKLNSGEILKGRMGSVTADQFTVQPRDAALGTARTVPFTEAQSVKADGLATWQKWTIGAVVTMVALGIVGTRV